MANRAIRYDVLILVFWRFTVIISYCRTTKNVKFNNKNKNNNIRKRPVNRNGAKNVLDARQKIIQKKRKTVIDARDVLAKMAKTQDARSKLVELRSKSKGGRTVAKGNVRVIGNSILRKTDRNGKISLVTSKSKQSTTNINLAIKQQLGLISPVRNAKKLNIKHLNSAKPLSQNMGPALIRKTIFNDEFSRPQVYDRFSQGFEQPDSLYRWVRPDMRATSPRRPLRLAARAELIEDNADWRAYSALAAR